MDPPAMLQRSSTAQAAAAPEMARQECWNCTESKDPEEQRSGETTAQDAEESKTTSQEELLRESLHVPWGKGMKRHGGKPEELLASFCGESAEDTFMHKNDEEGSKRDAKLDPMAFVVAGKAADPRLAQEIEKAMSEDD